ncbi:hypothetical protein [Rhodopirellula bahusiensis]|uniref:hypothetical protein n=1 Tax=Rhodopirellula bahusiensis TaxID=2014065 RepID=UPI00130457CB|nr:hypothetical protein [Rhodopirellula bahusiensis]
MTTPTALLLHGDQGGQMDGTEGVNAKHRALPINRMAVMIIRSTRPEQMESF